MSGYQEILTDPSYAGQIVTMTYTQIGNVGVNVAVPQPYAFFPLGSKRESFLGSAKSRMASKLVVRSKAVSPRKLGE